MSLNNKPENIADVIEVVGGSPSAEELATVIALLQAVHDQEKETATELELQHSSSWSRNRSQLRNPITPGPGQWRAAYRSGL
jgi:hypothetical protein